MRLVACMVGMVGASMASAAPVQLAHQGRLLTGEGTPISGTVPAEIRLFGVASGGVPLFDDALTLTVEDGYYATTLGANPSDLLDASVLLNPGGVWLEVAVDGTVVGPRQPLVSVPRAATATVATSVSGGSVVASSLQMTGSAPVVLGQDSGTSCSQAGGIVYDPVASMLKLCIGTTYVPVGAAVIVNVSGVRQWSTGPAATSCEKYRRPPSTAQAYIGATGDGYYRIDPDGDGAGAAWTAWCDMTTDNGGWTVVHSLNGADGQQPLVSDTEVGGDPATYGQYNISRAKKVALAAISTQTLFLRNSGPWLRMNAPLFDANLTVATQHPHTNVTLTARNGTTASAVSGYANYGYTSGGDYGLTSGGFDHHAGSTTYVHLNAACAGHYLYSYSGDVADSDAGYDVQVALGDWTATATCQGAEGGTLVFRTAMR